MIDYNAILGRETIYENIIKELNNFEINKNNISQKRGFYIYGESGIGKSYFIEDLLKNNNYNIIYYNASDIRNKNIIDNITKENMNSRSIIDMFHKRKKNIAIVMDEIDGMNSGDKGGINTLIKLIRPKKSKKQKEEITTNIPIFCISNGKLDKKMKELMKVCFVYKFNQPDENQIRELIVKLNPKINITNLEKIKKYVNYDLRKLNDIAFLYNNDIKNVLDCIFTIESHYEEAKEKVKTILNLKHDIKNHNYNISETDRTIISLILHENIIDINHKLNTKDFIKFYNILLKNFCYGDYIDRITFQKQIWQFNEMSSLIKTYYNQFLIHENFKHKNIYNSNDIRFTKVLTKYSTEYNNMNFIQTLCEKLNLDKKDMILFFEKNKYRADEEEFLEMLEIQYDIQKLDILRMFKFINYNNEEV